MEITKENNGEIVICDLPKVSVVIPVYNVENYLKSCINSVVNQTLKEIEIICVDDGSTDSSSEILNEFSAKDARIKVIRKDNAGYGHSMNVGFEAATGEYIGIVESDDIILPEMYETLYGQAKELDLDVVKSDCYLYWEKFDHKTRIYVDDTRKYYNKVLDASYRELYYRFWMFNWTGIYKREFIEEHNIRHNETPGASFQDNGFWLQVMAMCRSAMWIDKPFYLYRQDNPSASMKSRGKMMATIHEFDFAGEILKKKGLVYESKITNYYRTNEWRTAFFRIDDSLKREYADVVVEQYKKYKYDMAYTGHRIYDRNMQWIKEITSDTDGYCNMIINRKSSIEKRLNECENLIIYGAKDVAEAVIKRLYHYGFYDKISDVVVSKPEERQRLFGFNVRSVDEVLEYRNSSLVLIGVGYHTKAYVQIRAKLDELGFGNYMDTEELIRLFYVV